MTPEQTTQLLLLQLRSAIADKEWTIACANMETARGGWTCAWNEDMTKSEEKIRALISAITEIQKQ